MDRLLKAVTDGVELLYSSFLTAITAGVYVIGIIVILKLLGSI